MNDRLISLAMIFFAASTSLSCSSTNGAKEAPPKASATEKPKLSEIRKAEASTSSAPLKGKFLDYIYEIRPDHKADGYSINTKQLNNGYAFGQGPYDGSFVSFFLFRGKNKDLVFEQIDGYEVAAASMTYGHALSTYFFAGGKLQRKAPLREVLPLKEIDKLFETKIETLKNQDPKKTEGWRYYRLISLPVVGTEIDLKVCKEVPDPPFATTTPCLRVGSLKWNRENFTLHEDSSFRASEESI